MSHRFPALLLAIVCAWPAARATAGTVQIKSCADAPAGGADTAWQIVDEGLGGYEAPSAVCPPTGAIVGTDPDHDQVLGRSIWSRLNSGVAVPAGASGEIRFTAPAGTAVASVNIRRDLGKRNDGYRLYGATDTGIALDPTCAIPGGQIYCGVGGYNAGYQAFTGLSAQWVAWGFECGDLDFMTCSTGSSLHAVWAHVYGAVVTLTDNQLPTAVSAGGAVTTGGWKGGTVSGTISGSDNLGVQKLRWYADGALVSTSADRACDFSVAVPCTDASNVSYALDTSGLSDGSHNVQAAVVDPAGNETMGSAFEVQVDNTAPAAPTGLHVAGGGSSPNFSASWTNPAADGRAPYVSSAWQACVGGSCTSGTGGLTSATGTLPAGTATVKVWLVDQAGNGSASNAVSSTITYTAPAGGGGSGGGAGGGGTPTTPTTPGPTPTPGPEPTPGPASPAPAPAPTAAIAADANVAVTTATLSRATGRLTLAATAADHLTGRVTVRVRARVDGRWRTKTQHVAIRRGALRATTRIPTTWARKATAVRVTVTWPGSSRFKAATTTKSVRLR